MEDLVKIVVVGNRRSGKTSLVHQFAERALPRVGDATIGVDFAECDWPLEPREMQHTIQIWDVSGSKTFASLGRAYFRGCHGVMVVYDVTDPASFADVPRWIAEVQREVKVANRVIGGAGSHRLVVPTLVVGNKIDLTESRAVKLSEAQRKLREIPVMETSHQNSEAVDRAFEALIEHILATRPSGPRESIALLPRENTTRGCWPFC